MAGGSQDDDEIITSINVTPLVDIVLVLLIILMVTASYIASQNVPLQLPRSAETDEQLPPENINLVVTRDGQLLLDGESRTRDQLRQSIRDYTSRRPDGVVRISADRGVSHGRFVEILHLCRDAGAVHFGIATDPTGGDGE